MKKDTEYTEFLVLLRRFESSIYKYILVLTPNYSIAEDIMQETILTMWERFSTFQQGSDFFAWAKQIARFKTLSYFKTRKSRCFLSFDEKTLELLANEKTDASHHELAMLDALHNCIDKLCSKHKNFVLLRYSKNMKIKQISERWNVSSKTVMRLMAKIHCALLECIEKTLDAWELK